jgi:hypothetical protein
MTKTKNKLGRMAGTIPPDESSPHEKGGFPVPSLKHTNGLSAPVDSVDRQNKAMELAPSGQPFSLFVQKSGKLCFVAMPIAKLELEAVRQSNVLAMQRHLNLHHIMRGTFGSIETISVNAA